MIFVENPPPEDGAVYILKPWEVQEKAKTSGQGSVTTPCLRLPESKATWRNNFFTSTERASERAREERERERDREREREAHAPVQNRAKGLRAAAGIDRPTTPPPHHRTHSSVNQALHTYKKERLDAATRRGGRSSCSTTRPGGPRLFDPYPPTQQHIAHSFYKNRVFKQPRQIATVNNYATRVGVRFSQPSHRGSSPVQLQARRLPARAA